MPVNPKGALPIEEVVPPPTEIVSEGEAIGMRLDTWLSRLPGTPSRNRVQQLIKDGNVRVDGELAKAKYTITGGEHVTVNWPAPDDDWPWPQDIPLDIVYDDDQLAVINKQHGFIVHPSAGHPDGTLVNALLHRYPDLPGINGVKRPGIVHRLDRDTTGLMVIAKTERAMKSLAKQLEAREVKRRYLAVVLGDPEWDEITVDAAIGRDPVNRLKRCIDGPLARNAVSHFKVLRRAHQYALIGCQLETGRTHQIRVHLKHVGHPIVCDWTYDGALARVVERLTPGQHEIKRAFAKFDRPWLHARSLEFHHVDLNKRVKFMQPPPPDSRELLDVIFDDDGGAAIAEICGERMIDLGE